jgi:hypothetical protein
MTTDTKDKIIAYIRYHGQARAQDLFETLGISRVAVHRQLKKLLEEGVLVRVGKPPIVFYTLSPDVAVTQTSETGHLPAYTQQIIDAHFLSITPDGKLLYGMVGFVHWAQNFQKNKPIETVAEEYVAKVQEQKKLFSAEGWIDATPKLVETFTETPISHLLFEEIYSYRTFGWTKLSKLVMYAKQTGDKKLIDQIAESCKPIIEAVIKKYHIEAVAFIPPTVPRPRQFMDELEYWLKIPLPKIELVKIMPGDIPIPQKTLASLNERVINARDTIYLKSNKEFSYENILLIDDVIGSGASFHETAKKLKNANVGFGDIIAFGMVGNIKGYDVVREI